MDQEDKLLYAHTKHAVPYNAIRENSQFVIVILKQTKSLHTSNLGIFLLVPPSNASTGKNANAGPFMSTRKFCKVTSFQFILFVKINFL